MRNHTASKPAPITETPSRLAIPLGDSTHQVDDFAATYPGLPVSFLSEAPDTLRNMLVLHHVQFAECGYFRGLVFDAEHLPLIFRHFSLNSAEFVFYSEDLTEVATAYIQTEELLGDRDISDNGAHRELMFDMLHQADCFREPLAMLYSATYSGETGEYEVDHFTKDGLPDLGI